MSSLSLSSEQVSMDSTECGYPPVLERLILIDGANFMHAVKSVYPADRTLDQ